MLSQRLTKHMMIVVIMVVTIILSGCDNQESDRETTSHVSATDQPEVGLIPRVGLELVATGLNQPLGLTHAGDERLFIVERPGRIRIWRNGVVLPEAFLDISALTTTDGERGLLSVAFHPQYAEPGTPGAGLFWINYTNLNGHTVIARYAVSPGNPDRAATDSALIVLTITQPFSNHNGGQIHFGPIEGIEQRRYLYIGMGDGGSGGDPDNHAQRDDSLLGKMLRIDPSTAPVPIFPYTVPPDNPRAGEPPPRNTIWASGLRNPWRFSFDAANGDLYIGDVGQNAFEEIHMTQAGTPGGLNYGWRTLEGETCFNPPTNCDRSGLELPIFTYDHRAGCAVIGGYVYRGIDFPALVGTYIFADLCSGHMMGLNETAPGDWRNTLLQVAQESPLSFGEDSWSELYLGVSNGNIYRIVLKP